MLQSQFEGHGQTTYNRFLSLAIAAYVSIRP